MDDKFETISEIKYDELIFRLPLYKKVNVNWSDLKEITSQVEFQEYGYSEEYNTYYPEDFQKLINFIKNSFIIYGKCPNCNKDLAFNVEKSSLAKALEDDCILSYSDAEIDGDRKIPDSIDIMKRKVDYLVLHHNYFDKTIQCPMCDNIYKAYYKINLKSDDKGENYRLSLQKVGQYPSLHELSDYSDNGYTKLLKKIDALDELRCGYSLQNSGYNVGAYTYLRRVLEKFIIYKFNKNKQNLQYSYEEFKSKHMDEKLTILKEYLPSFLQENKEIYSVISAGIHMLSEDKCEEYFPIIKSAIEAILSEEEANRKKEYLKKLTSNRLKNAKCNIQKDLNENR